MRYIIILIAFISLKSYSTEIESAFASAALIKKPIPKEVSWSKANNANFEICLSEDNKNNISVKLEEECKVINLAVNFMGNTFVGTNHGEFGGNLSVNLPNGTEQVLIHDNVVQIISLKSELFVFTGLSHMMTDRGAIYRVFQKEGVPVAERITLLPGAPEFIVTPNNNLFYIVTSSGLLKFNRENEELSALLIDQFWGGLYPTSAVLRGNQLAIGMRSGAALIDFDFPSGVGKVRYYTKKF
jgi:hypothetical protein